ncbi:MAG: DinB family protein [Lewinella sp.]|nr:DinB family protein [Lewinella sp.]
MPTFSSTELLHELRQQVTDGIQFIRENAQQPATDWQRPPANGGWSAVEVVAHLNFYAGFYTQAVEQVLAKAKGQPTARFRSGWFGNYFTRIIGPAPEGGALAMKMPTPDNAQPKPASELDQEREIATFLSYQETLLRQLEHAQAVPLGRLRVPTSLSPLIRLKLGDTFRFVIAHQQRHFQQIARALQAD